MKCMTLERIAIAMNFGKNQINKQSFAPLALETATFGDC